MSQQRAGGHVDEVTKKIFFSNRKEIKHMVFLLIHHHSERIPRKNEAT